MDKSQFTPFLFALSLSPLTMHYFWLYCVYVFFYYCTFSYFFLSSIRHFADGHFHVSIFYFNDEMAYTHTHTHGRALCKINIISSFIAYYDSLSSIFLGFAYRCSLSSKHYE